MSRIVRRALLAPLLACCLLLSGCMGGQEIENCLFVLSLAVDAAPGGNLTVTIKALSGTQEASSAPSAAGEEGSGSTGTPAGGTGKAALEEAEPGYIVLSATAPSCLRALGLLSATTPRTMNLSQLREVVISRTLAETDATLTILTEIRAMYRANGEAVVVITPGNAGDFIRRQHAILGLRLSKYLEVLFDHFGRLDVIPAKPNLASVVAAMQSGTIDAVAVYAAGNDFDATLVLPGAADIDRLPGHLPRTAPAENEYMGAAVFDGPRMTDTLTGSETGLLSLMLGRAQTRTTIIGGAQYQLVTRARVSRRIEPDGTLSVRIRMRLALIAGEQKQTEQEIAAELAQSCVNLLHKLQAARSDAAGFGRIAIRRCPDIPSWNHLDWQTAYPHAPVRVNVEVEVL